MREKIIYRLATEIDLNQVTYVHMTAFQGFFLTNLGPYFLQTMYKTFLLNKKGIFAVSECEKKILGFAVGTLNSAGHDRNLSFRFLPQFIFAVLPSIIRSPRAVIGRIGRQFFSSNEKLNIPDNSAILRSIGVLTSFKGTGIAGQLLQNFELHANLKGADFVALTTDAVNNERTINFYRKNGYKISQEFKQDKTRSMYLMTKKISQSTSIE